MGWLDKAKVMLGVIDKEDLAEDAPPRARRGTLRQDGRPSLDGVRAAPQHSLDDALMAREAGNLDEMRRLLRDMDRGAGLRTVLRAAAALEADDETELLPLLPKVRAATPAWRLPLQVAMVLDDKARAALFLTRAERAQAPAWALGWAQALSADPHTSNAGLVKLLFSHAALARTVAARDLELAGAEQDTAAIERYAAFAHGRTCIRRFGAAAVADLLDKAHQDSA
ncbi:MAG TPA: hypothetical protein ENK23_06610 [Sorangium sp.]|nr:hypothetical protein [Sorangium sp.]